MTAVAPQAFKGLYVAHALGVIQKWALIRALPVRIKH